MKQEKFERGRKETNSEKPARKFVKKHDNSEKESFRNERRPKSDSYSKRNNDSEKSGFNSDRKRRDDSPDYKEKRTSSPERKSTSRTDDSRPRRTFSSDNDEKRPFKPARKEFNKEERPDRRRASSDSEDKKPFRASKPRLKKDDDRKFSRDKDERKTRFLKDGDDRKSKFSKDSNDRKSKFSKPDKNRSYSEYKEEGRKKKSGKSSTIDSDNEIRLNRYIANAGICSRREADELIAAGLVSVNGKIVTELGTKVRKTDDIKFDGGKIFSEKKVYILLNKPKDYITTVEDPHAKHTVLELLKGAGKERVYPVGRLDRMTTGVLLLTNDGDLTKKLTHPKYQKKKIYHVTLDKSLTQADLKQLASGVQVEEGIVGFDAISYASKDNKTEIGVEIHYGMNRIVRRMFESLGYTVKKLDRVYFAGLTKKGLERGHWRYLTPKEINMLLMGAYE